MERAPAGLFSSGKGSSWWRKSNAWPMLSSSCRNGRTIAEGQSLTRRSAPASRAYDGQVPISVAREAFAGFARSAKILEDASAAMTAQKTGRGGVTA